MSDASELYRIITKQTAAISRMSTELHEVRALHRPTPYLTAGGTDRACPLCGPVGNGYGPLWPCATYLAAGGSPDDKP